MKYLNRGNCDKIQYLGVIQVHTIFKHRQRVKNQNNIKLQQNTIIFIGAPSCLNELDLGLNILFTFKQYNSVICYEKRSMFLKENIKQQDKKIQLQILVMYQFNFQIVQNLYIRQKVVFFTIFSQRSCIKTVSKSKSYQIYLYIFIIKYQKFLVLMFQENNKKPILVYFNTRGHAQIIRCVLLEIQLEFQEVLIGFDGYINPKISQKYQIDIKNLPYFIHDGNKIKGIFPIIKYICNTWNRTDLLGKNIKDNAIITQIMTKQIRAKGVILAMLLKGLKEIYTNKLGKQGVDKLKQKMIQVAETQKLLHPIRNMFKNTRGYLCGYLTVVDFAYYDKVFYSLNFYGQNLPELKFGKEYVGFFQSTQFYKKHAKKLSEYKIIYPELAQQFNNIMKLMWNGDPKYITTN